MAGGISRNEATAARRRIGSIGPGGTAGASRRTVPGSGLGGMSVNPVAARPGTVDVWLHLDKEVNQHRICQRQYQGKGLGDAFTDDVKEAWITAYGILAATMKDAASEMAA
jgi:hypothetical protein